MTFEELSKFDNNKGNFEQLIKHINSESVVPLFGAGLSKAAVDYPLWKDLLLSLSDGFCIRDEIEEIIVNKGFEEAATKLCEDYGEFDFKNRIYNIFKADNLNGKIIPNFIKVIPKIFRNIIMTTNFDNVIEKLYLDQNKVLNTIDPKSEYDLDFIESSLQKNESILIKLHGDIEHTDHIVLTSDDYNKCYGYPQVDFSLPMPKILKEALSSKIILFIGCSLEKDRLMDIFDSCNKNKQYFALLELPEETNNSSNPYQPLMDKSKKIFFERRKILSNKHIKCIWYPYNQHEALKVFLEELGKGAILSTKKKEYLN